MVSDFVIQASVSDGRELLFPRFVVHEGFFRAAYSSLSMDYGPSTIDL